MIVLLHPTVLIQAQETLELGTVPIALRTSELSAIEKAYRAREIFGRRFSLSQFGYDLFDAPRLAQEITQAPVGPLYVVGPDDHFLIRITGRTEEEHRATVDREGRLALPKVGTVSVWGLTFGEVRELIAAQISQYYSGVRIDVSMDRLRTIEVFVMGEVLSPGMYEVSSLATVIPALFAAGGVKHSGSLRRIHVLRDNEVVQRVDLYDFLLTGSRRADVRLQAQDVVFVPRIGPVAGIAGEVKRPGIYELSDGETLADLVQLANGLTPSAHVGNIRIERFEDNLRRVLIAPSFDNASALLGGGGGRPGRARRRSGVRSRLRHRTAAHPGG